jgi:Tol biopolymer transport system component
MNALAARQILGIVMLLIAGSTALRAQTQQDVPTIEPTYTRVFGSDTLEIGRRPSMSPDGRWIAFSVFEGMNRSNLWIVSSEGGEPIRLTDGDHTDDGIVWFPNGDRIAFRSIDRLPFVAIMTLAIDRETGRPVGSPRAVTLEGSAAYFDVSPDGRWIAYTPRDEPWYPVIRIVPSTGGTARTLTGTQTRFPVWGPDGRNIYYTLWIGDERIVMRIAVDGGEPDTVFKWPRRILHEPGPNRGHVLLTVSDDPPTFELATIEGHSVARVTLPEGMEPAELTADNQLLARKVNRFTPLRILPVDGGPARQLTDGSAHAYPLGWTRDGRVFFKSKLNGDDILLLAPADGGAMRQVRVPEPRMAEFAPVVLSDDGEYLLYAVSQNDPKLSTLKVLSLGDGRSSILTRAHARDGFSLLGRGGTPNRDGADFLYVESKGDVRELRASPPEGPSRLLWSFAAEQMPSAVTVRGDRIAFVENRETTLQLAAVGDHETSEVLRLAGKLDVVVWSPDGRWLAATHFDTLATENADKAWIVFVQVSPSGQLVGQPRFAGDKMQAWWNLRWLPDSRGILATGMDGNVWLIPVDPDASPVCLTRDDPGVSWNFVVSPDGRHIAYHVVVPRGSSIWRVDLGIF